MLPDAEILMVEWVKTDTTMRALLGHPALVRVATRFPLQSVFPGGFLRIVRTGGTREQGEAPIDNPLLQWDVLASRPGGGPDLTLASLIIRTLVDRLDLINDTGGIALTGGYVYGVRFISGPERVDGPPDTEAARYLLDTELWVRQ